MRKASLRMAVPATSLPCAFLPVPMLCTSAITNQTAPLSLTIRCSRTPRTTPSPKSGTSTSFPPRNAPQPTSTNPATVPSPSPPPLSSIALLNLTTVLWATQHSIIKQTLSTVSPSSLNFLRFLLASVISLPSLPRPSARTLPLFRAGVELGLYLFLGYALQSVSLQTIPASRSAFLLYLNVKLVPIFSSILYRTRLRVATILSASLAFAGTTLLTLDSTASTLSLSLSTGDFYSILAAAASALFILRLETHASHPAAQLNAVSLTTVAALAFAWTLCQAPEVGFVLPESPQAWGGVLYLGVVTTALCNFLQTVGQKDVPSQNAAVIFALDPVYAAAFAAWWLGESVGTWGVAGGGAIVLAAVVSALDTKRNEKN